MIIGAGVGCACVNAGLISVCAAGLPLAAVSAVVVPLEATAGAGLAVPGTGLSLGAATGLFDTTGAGVVTGTGVVA